MRGCIHVQTNPDPSRGRSVVSGQLSIPLSYRTPKKDCQGLKKEGGGRGRNSADATENLISSNQISTE